MNKYTGEIIWRALLGDVASHIYDPDNWLYFLQSPVVTETVSRRKVVLIGSASSQYFQGALYTNAYGTSPSPLSLLDQLDFQMTDIGKLFIVDADTGTLLKIITTGPALFRAGDIIPSSAQILPITDDKVVIRHLVSPADVEEGGVLNPVTPEYGGENYMMTFVLEVGDGTATVPASLDGIYVLNTENKNVVLRAGELITETLQNVVCTVAYRMTTGTTSIFFPERDLTLATTDPSTGLAGQTGIRPVRLARRVTVGQVMDAETAYQLNLYGACITGNTIAVAPGKDGFYFTTDQPHFVPYQQAMVVNDDLIPFIQVQYVLWIYQHAYESDPSPLTYEWMQDINHEYQDWYTVYTPNSIRKSERYESFYFSSIVMASLHDDTLGDILWAYKSTGYDFWTSTAENGRSKSNPYGYSDIGLYLERPVGANGGFGQGVYITTERPDRMVACNRAGFLYVFDISGNTPSLRNLTYIGNSVVNGASNYGSTLSGSVFVTIVTQAYQPDGINSSYPNFPPQMSWYITPLQRYPPLNSFVQAWDIETLKVLWSKPVIPHDASPYACTLSQISSTTQFVFIPASNGVLTIRDLFTGELVHQIPLDGNGGQSSPIFSHQHMYAVLGRSEFASVYNLEGSACHYGPAQHLYAFTSTIEHIPPQVSIQVNLRQYTLNNWNTGLGFFTNATLETSVSDLYKIIQTRIRREPPLATILQGHKWALYDGTMLLHRQDRFTKLNSLPRPSDSSLILSLLYSGPRAG